MRSAEILLVIVTLTASGSTAAQPEPEVHWTELATPTPARFGTEYIPVGKRAGRFAKLRVDLTQGRVTVNRIRVHFTDGKTQTANVERTLNDAHRTVSIELSEIATLERVDVTTDTWPDGSYTLSGAVVPPPARP